MSNERTPRGKRRPFVQVPHLEELELGNRELAIFLRILWFLDDQAWRHDGSNAGAAAITEGTLRQLAGTTRLDHAEAWLKVAVSRFPRARWIPVAVAENGLITAIMELAKVLPQEEAPKFSLPAIQARYPRIRGFLWFPNPAESLTLAAHTRPDNTQTQTTPDKTHTQTPTQTQTQTTPDQTPTQTTTRPDSDHHEPEEEDYDDAAGSGIRSGAALARELFRGSPVVPQRRGVAESAGGRKEGSGVDVEPYMDEEPYRRTHGGDF